MFLSKIMNNNLLNFCSAQYSPDTKKSLHSKHLDCPNPYQTFVMIPEEDSMY